jgi:hypothetical protein
MKREYYGSSIANFRTRPPQQVLGELVQGSGFDIDRTQRDAWQGEIEILQRVLSERSGHVYFEYSIPRIGRRIDAVLVMGPAIFVLEFKVGEQVFRSSAIDQVYDYALDLKNFHETSSAPLIAPILVATHAQSADPSFEMIAQEDKLLAPLRCNGDTLGTALDAVLDFASGQPDISAEAWERGRYWPTPTIIEAALALYNGHSVSDISRNDATAINLSRTSEAIGRVIRNSQDGHFKSICFVTGVPGAGKTLVGLNAATQHQDLAEGLHSVFLSGNGPLVRILREALARDNIRSAQESGRKLKRGEARSKVQAFIQNVHHFRDECLIDVKRPPIEHVALFDEAQRAWNLAQTSAFMKRKKAMPDFAQSEPEFLISCLDRHQDWAVVVCLVGGGQEINTGEAGIKEWIDSLNRSFLDWRVHISPQLSDSEYGAGSISESLALRPNVSLNEDLHLAVSMRSFRASNLSHLVKQLLDLDASGARRTLESLEGKYPIVVTRDLAKAKHWLKHRARGTERYGIVVSSQAERLKPHAIDVKSPMDPVHWFLDGKADVRSSYYLEDVATEFDVQGLELDWTCVTWDADFRKVGDKWQHWSFQGTRWNKIHKQERQTYLKNAYRVLLTRARQGMVIVVPPGDSDDPTRHPDLYDSTYQYLSGIGFSVI